jgi:hypothetical protein
MDPDPDPHLFRSAGWSGSRRAKINWKWNRKYLKTVKKFHVLTCWIYSLVRAGGVRLVVFTEILLFLQRLLVRDESFYICIYSALYQSKFGGTDQKVTFFNSSPSFGDHVKGSEIACSWRDYGLISSRYQVRVSSKADRVPVSKNQCCGSMTFWCGSGFRIRI